MILYGVCRMHTILNEEKIPSFDYIEVTTREGRVLTIDWDESSWAVEQNFLHFRCKGVYFNEEYANGKGKLLAGGRVTGMQLFLNGNEELKIQKFHLVFDDNHQEYQISGSGNDPDLEIVIEPE